MRTNKINLIIVIAIMMSSFGIAQSQNSSGKIYFQHIVKNRYEFVRELPKYRKTQFKQSEKGNLNEFTGENAIKSVEWRFNPNVKINGKFEFKDVYVDEIIVMEDWMLDSSKMMTKSDIEECSQDEKIELSEWMLDINKFDKI